MKIIVVNMPKSWSILVQNWVWHDRDGLFVTVGQKSDGGPETVPVKTQILLANGQKDGCTADPETWHNSLPEAPSLASSETKTGSNYSCNAFPDTPANASIVLSSPKPSIRRYNMTQLPVDQISMSQSHVSRISKLDWYRSPKPSYF